MMEAMAASPTSTITAVIRPVESAVGSMAEPASARSSDASARIASAIRVVIGLLWRNTNRTPDVDRKRGGQLYQAGAVS